VTHANEPDWFQALLLQVNWMRYYDSASSTEVHNVIVLERFLTLLWSLCSKLSFPLLPVHECFLLLHLLFLQELVSAELPYLGLGRFLHD
jgi:hypothetical protein